MNPLVRLYPAAWRERYGDEFSALLEDMRLSPFDVIDIVLAALDAHLRPQPATTAGQATKETLMTQKTFGFVAIAAGSLMLLAVMLGPVIYPLVFGTLLVAVAGLSASWGRERTRWAWLSTLLPAGGLILALLGLGLMAMVGNWALVVGDLSAYHVFGIGLLITLAGSVVFAVNGVANVPAQRAPAMVLTVSSVVMFIGVAFQAFAWSPVPDAAVNSALVGGATLYALAWIWLGSTVALAERSEKATPT